jgi:hypothetical protein
MITTVVRRHDSEGYEHFICAQSQLNTCAAAALFMFDVLPA